MSFPGGGSLYSEIMTTAKGAAMGNALTTWLWFDTEAEEAARFYCDVFKDSRIGAVSHYGEGGPREAGLVMVAEFELNGQKFAALNGGSEPKFNHAVSFSIPCADQAEVDYYWDRLTDGGQGVACGWLTDRYGLSWQVIPTPMMTMMSDPDTEKAQRVTAAMLKMVKIDLVELRRAFDGD
jgi:predicted 3-demethylubiquinone-9 3-methyltransferase (glyoxalase superfamily)